MVFRQSHSSLYLKVDDDVELSPLDEPHNVNISKIGNASCVTKFIKTLLSLVSRVVTLPLLRLKRHFFVQMEHGAKAHLKHLTEYFNFLYEFSKMGDEEAKFLLAVGAINSMVHFYLGQKANDFVSRFFFWK